MGVEIRARTGEVEQRGGEPFLSEGFVQDLMRTISHLLCFEIHNSISAE